MSLGSIGSGGFDPSTIFKRIDANHNGKVTKEEFLSARPNGVSESEASSLFAKIDSKGTGEVSEAEFNKSLKNAQPPKRSGNLGSNLSDEIMAILTQLAQSAQTESGAQANQTPEDLFTTLDTDKNGAVSKKEFIAGRPEGINEEQAGALFSQLDSKGTGSISEEDFTAFAKNAPNGGKPPQGARLSQTNTDELINQLLEAVNSYSKQQYNNYSNYSRSTTYA